MDSMDRMDTERPLAILPGPTRPFRPFCPFRPFLILLLPVLLAGCVRSSPEPRPGELPKGAYRLKDTPPVAQHEVTASLGPAPGATLNSTRGAVRVPTPVPPVPATATAGEQIEQCPVCRHDHNPVGADVVVTRSTPRLTYNGVVYYFSGRECRAQFLKQPRKYVAE